MTNSAQINHKSNFKLHCTFFQLRLINWSEFFKIQSRYKKHYAGSALKVTLASSCFSSKRGLLELWKTNQASLTITLANTFLLPLHKVPVI